MKIAKKKSSHPLSPPPSTPPYIQGGWLDLSGIQNGSRRVSLYQLLLVLFEESRVGEDRNRSEPKCPSLLSSSSLLTPLDFVAFVTFVRCLIFSGF